MNYDLRNNNFALDTVVIVMLSNQADVNYRCECCSQPLRPGAAGVSWLRCLGAGESQCCKLLVRGTLHERSGLGVRTALNFLLIHGHAASCKSLTG